MKIIFLDIDGVLITRNSINRTLRHRTFDEEAVENLNRVIEKTDADIVVSSTFRLNNDVLALQKLLNANNVKGLVLDRTPGFEHEDVPISIARPRGLEINAWLKSFREEFGESSITSFVIVDDDSDMAMHMDRLVQTDFETGLQSKHADAMIKLLQQEV